MLYSKKRFEQYAMKVEETSQTDNRFWVDVDELAKQLEPLGFTAHDCHFFAALLEDEGWAKLQFLQVGKTRMKLTLQGYREIEKLHKQSAFRRWAGKNAALMVSMVAIVVSLASFAVALLSLLLK